MVFHSILLFQIHHAMIRENLFSKRIMDIMKFNKLIIQYGVRMVCKEIWKLNKKNNTYPIHTP